MRTTLKIALPLIISVAVVSLLFAAYQVRTERKNLRNDLSRRAELLAESLQESIEPQFEKGGRGSEKAMQRVVDRFAQREHMKGIAVYQADGSLLVMTSTLGSHFQSAPATAIRAIAKDKGESDTDSVGETPIYFYSLPLHRDDKAAGALLLIYDTSYIDSRILHTLRDALLTALLETILITALALVLVRWTFMDPLRKTVKWLQQLRKGEGHAPHALPQGELFDQINAEVTHLARDLGVARAAAEEEARLRDSNATQWTAERLRVSLRSKLHDRPLFVVSNREP